MKAIMNNQQRHLPVTQSFEDVNKCATNHVYYLGSKENKGTVHVNTKKQET